MLVTFTFNASARRRTQDSISGKTYQSQSQKKKNCLYYTSKQINFACVIIYDSSVIFK
jgi:hypothetical protein